MVYCTKCGIQNEDDAAFCNNCNKPLKTKKKDAGENRVEDWGNKIERDFYMGSGSGPAIFALGLILLGTWIIFVYVLGGLTGMPEWIYELKLWYILPALVLLVIVHLIFRETLSNREFKT